MAYGTYSNSGPPPPLAFRLNDDPELKFSINSDTYAHTKMSDLNMIHNHFEPFNSDIPESPGNHGDLLDVSYGAGEEAETERYTSENDEVFIVDRQNFSSKARLMDNIASDATATTRGNVRARKNGALPFMGHVGIENSLVTAVIPPDTQSMSISTQQYSSSNTSTTSSLPRISQNHLQNIRNYDIRGACRQTEQSRHLPQGIQYILLKILGVKRNSGEKTYLSKFLLIITVLLGLLYFVVFVWYKGYDIANLYTKSTLLTGLVEIILCLVWVFLGIYAHMLAGRLFQQTNIMKSVRTRTKTILKMNAAVILTVVGICMVGLMSYRRYNVLDDKTCGNITSLYVCRVLYASEVSYSIVGLLWNILVGFVVLSVTRTHTIGLRKFLKVLDRDAQICNKYLRSHSSARSRHISAFIDVSTKMGCDDKQDSKTDWYVAEEHQDQPDFVCLEDSTSTHVQVTRNEQQAEEYADFHHHIMSNDEILTCYWKINRHLRSTSESLQRWQASWMSFIFMWCMVNVLYWSTHTSTVIAISCFVIPLLVIPLLSSAYAEANAEGLKIPRKHIRAAARSFQRWMFSWIVLILIWSSWNAFYWTFHNPSQMAIVAFALPIIMAPIVSSSYAETNAEGVKIPRTIFPLEERIAVIYLTSQQPLQMTVFNIAITFQVIMGTVAAVILAFLTRILIGELG